MTRPLVLTALALGVAAATPAGAQPSPYAPGSYAAGAAGDRYGPAIAAAPAPPRYGQVSASPASPPPLRGRVLAWPGKVEAPGPIAHVQAAPAALVALSADRTYTWRQGSAAPNAYGPLVSAQPDRSSATRGAVERADQAGYGAVPARSLRPTPHVTPAAYASSAERPSTGPRALAAALAGAPTDGWRPVFAGQGAAPAGPTAPADPTSAPAYTPAAAIARAAPPNRAFAADRRYGYDPTLNHSVRLYSVARPFGLKPDPAPIPPQFFTATADLGGDPPGPLPVNHTTAATRAAVVGGGSDTGGQ